MNHTRFPQLKGVLAACLLGVGLALFVTGLTREAIWFDESFTLAVTRPPFALFWQRVTVGEGHPPLYFLGLYAWRAMVGDALFAARLFSALGALTLAALGLGPVRQALGEEVGTAFTFLAVSLPGVLFMAQEARPYAWAATLVTCSVVFTFLALRDNRGRDWVAVGGATLAAIYTDYYAALTLALFYALVLGWLLAERRTRLYPLALTLALVGCAYLPWLPIASRQGDGLLSSSAVAPVTIATIAKTVVFPFGFKFGVPILIFPWLTLLAVAGLVAWGGWAAWRASAPLAPPLLLGVAAYALVLVVGIALSLAWRPVLRPRSIFPALGLLLLLAAYGLAALPLRRRVAVASVLLLVVAPTVGLIKTQVFNSPLPAVVAYLATQGDADAAFVHVDYMTLGPFTYHLPDARHFAYDPYAVGNAPEPLFAPHAERGSDVAAFVVAHPRAWLVGCTGADNCAIAADLLLQGRLTAAGPTREFATPYAWQRLTLTPVAVGPAP